MRRPLHNLLPALVTLVKHAAHVALVALAISLVAPAPAAPAKAPAVPPVRFSEYSLGNGLRVLLAPDASAPVVAVCLTYNVGSFVEPPGKTGFAHLFEHLMFQGSKNLPKGGFDTVVVNSGGDDNGETWPDRTHFYITMPANRLEAALYVLADTTAHLDVTQQNLDNQRTVVQEERRRSVDNQPYGRLYETLQENAYTNFAYKHPTIGSLADLDAANLGDVARFYKTYYAPNNAVLSVVGDFDGRETRAWIAEHFGPIPRGPEPEFPSLAEPPQSEERRVTLKDPLAPLPAYVAGYKVPPGNGPDFAALDVLATVLTGGKTSRLGKLLVEERQLATSVDADVDPGRGPGLFTIEMDFGPGQSVDAAEAALDAEIARIREKGVTPEEVRRAQRLRRRDVLAARRSAQERAIALGANAVMFDDPNRVNTYPDAFQRVTPADVRRVAARYLSPGNRTVVIDVPAPETAPETAAPETAAPETAAPETAAPETAAPETAARETGNAGEGEGS